MATFCLQDLSIEKKRGDIVVDKRNNEENEGERCLMVIIHSFLARLSGPSHLDVHLIKHLSVDVHHFVRVQERSSPETTKVKLFSLFCMHDERSLSFLLSLLFIVSLVVLKTEQRNF
jgi:hypothetical protein